MTFINPNFGPKWSTRAPKKGNNFGNGEEKVSNNDSFVMNRNTPNTPSIKVPVDTLIASNGIKIGTGNMTAKCNSEPEVHKISPEDFERIQNEGHKYPEGDYIEVRFAEYTCQYYVDKGGYLDLVDVKPH